MGEIWFTKKDMGLLDNIDKQLENINRVKVQQEVFESVKIKKNKSTKFTRKGYFENKAEKKSLRKLRRKKFKKLKVNNRKYKRCPQRYETYINSNWWTKRKNLYFQSHQRICMRCNSTKFIVVHHAFYGELGNERDEHLFALCKDCHNLFHTLYPTRKDMIEDTIKHLST